MTFLLSASGWNVFVKWVIIIAVESISFDSKIHRTLYLNVSFITTSELQAGGHLLKSVLGS